MPWMAIVAVILQILQLPAVQEWIRRLIDWLLTRQAQTMANPETFASSTEGIRALFDGAIARLPRLAFARRALLRAVKRAAMARAPEIYAAATAEGAVVPPLGEAERAELADVADAAEVEVVGY